MTNIYFDEDVVVHCLCKYFFGGRPCVCPGFIKFRGILKRINLGYSISIEELKEREFNKDS